MHTLLTLPYIYNYIKTTSSNMLSLTIFFVIMKNVNNMNSKRNNRPAVVGNYTRNYTSCGNDNCYNK